MASILLPTAQLAARAADVAPVASLRQRHSLSNHNHTGPLDSRRQDVFCGHDRRALFLSVPTAGAGAPATPRLAHDGEQTSSSRRGGCGAASMSYNFYSNGGFEREEYIEAHVIEAVRMVPSREHLYMTMADGSEVEVEHVNPTAGRLLYLNSMPTIFLRMADSTNLLLPIVVGDLAIGFLMKAFKRDGNARPNHYELMRDITDALQAEIKHVKITQRVGDTYYARIFMAKPGETGLVSVDARPSDAVNLAMRAGVPIFVSRTIVQNDAVRVVFDQAKHGQAQPRKPMDASNPDRPLLSDDDMLEEIALIKSMQMAAEEERYADAAQLRDQLTALRTRSKTQLNKVDNRVKFSINGPYFNAWDMCSIEPRWMDHL